MSRPALCLTLTFITFASNSTFGQQSAFEIMKRQLPGDANIAMAVDISGTLQAPLASDGSWQLTGDSSSRSVQLPGDGDKAIVATYVNISDNFRRSTGAAVVSMKNMPSMNLIARAGNGHVEQIGGRSAAWTSGNRFYADLGSNHLGIMVPGDRQAAFKWVESAGKAVSPRCVVLAANAVTSGDQIAVAIDMKNAPQIQNVTRLIQASGVADKYGINAQLLAAKLSAIDTIVIHLSITDTMKARAELTFGEPLGISNVAAKELTLSALGTLGAEIPGLEDWQISTSGQQILIAGDPSPAAFRCIMSLMEFPSVETGSVQVASPAEESASKMAASSLEYFTTVVGLIDSLKEQTKNVASDSYWIERYAQKIDRLPIMDVDPDLLDYGEKTAQTLRVISRIPNVPPSQRDNSFDRQAYEKKQNGYKLIDDATAQLRRTMTERYRIAF